MLGNDRIFSSIMNRQPHAIARVQGSDSYPDILGIVKFFQTNRGVLVAAEVEGLPFLPGACEHFVFGFHIHEGTECSGNEEDVFAGAMAHYNPWKCPHPRHAGDLPPLFANGDYAFLAVLTDRFVVEEVIGRTVIIHASPDDFKTQPAGNAGEKIACGLIEKLNLGRS